MRKILTAALFAVALAPFAAHANMAEWKEKDTDGDGRISKSEMSAYSDKKFMEMDKNGDGYISKDEKGVMHKAEAKTKNAWDKTKAKAREVKEDIKENSEPAQNSTINNGDSHQ